MPSNIDQKDPEMYLEYKTKTDTHYQIHWLSMLTKIYVLIFK